MRKRFSIYRAGWPSSPVAGGLYGSAISAGLCEMGATVVVASRNLARCEELAASLRAAGHSAVGMALDLDDDASIRALAKGVTDRFGQIDILVNNAVDRSNMAPLSTATRRQLQASASTNLNGQILLSQAVLESMVARQRGSIINISSMRGLDCPPFSLLSAVHGRSARELHHGKMGHGRADEIYGRPLWQAPYPRELHSARRL